VWTCSITGKSGLNYREALQVSAAHSPRTPTHPQQPNNLSISISHPSATATFTFHALMPLGESRASAMSWAIKNSFRGL
jgi:hypothetical protein